MGLFDWINTLKNDLGSIADAIIPGDQSSWHQSAPAPAPSQPQRAAAAAIGAGAGLGPSNPAVPTSAPTAPTPVAAPIFKLQPPPIIAPHVNMPLETIKQAVVGSGKSIAGAAVDVAHGLADIPVHLATQGADVLDPTQVHTFQAQDPVRKFIFGDQPVTSYTNQAGQFSQFLQDHGVNSTAANVAAIPAAGVLAGLDLFTGGKGKTVAEGIAKADTTKAVETLLTSHFGASADKIPPEVVDALTQTQDPKQVAQILNGHFVKPGNSPITADQYRATLKQQIADEISHAASNGPQTKNPGYTTAQQAMFKEFQKNPDKFIDRYQLMPADMRPGAATTPTAIYHGTTPEAAAAIEKNGFDQAKSADGSHWFTTNPKIGEQAATGKGGIVQRGVDESKMKLGGWNEDEKYTTDQLLQMGYDGLKLPGEHGETVYKIFNPEKLSGSTVKPGEVPRPNVTIEPRPGARPETPPALPTPPPNTSNGKKVSLPDILPSMNKTVNPGITDSDLKWAKDNGFAAPDSTLGMNKSSLVPEGVTPEQLDRPPKGPHMGNSLTPSLHEPLPVRSTPRTPLLSDEHLDVPGKAPVDTKAPKISLTIPKNEKSVVKGFGAIKTIIGRQGTAGRELATRIVNVREMHRQLGQTFKDSVPTVLKLSKDEFKNFVATVEGNAAPATDKIAKAVTEWQTTAKAIESRATQAGIHMGHIEDYFPHTYDNKLFTDRKTFTAAAEHLVNTGQATDLQNAVQQINDLREPWQGGHRFGNLEKARNLNIPGYKQDKGVVLRYLDKSSRRIAEAEQFGRDNEHVDHLIGGIAKEGKDANAAQEAFNAYWQRPADGVLSKAASGGRKVSSYLTLSKAAISHSTQTANTAIVTGNLRTAHAWIKSLGGKDRAWAKSIGINYDGHAGASISGIAPGLRQMRAQNRIVSALAGRAYGRALAKRGKTEILANKWGVQGEIGKKLTPAQEAHMGHAMADATQFSDDPADLPTWARTPAGKLVGQYRMSYQYKQGGFLFDHIIKEAGRGNLMPAIRALAVIPAAGAAVVGVKQALGGKTSPSDLGADVEAGGLGTIPTSLLASTKYMYDGPSTATSIASDVAPLAGQLVQTGLNIHTAAEGNTKPLGKQVLGYIPFVGGLVKNAAYPSSPADPNAIAYVQNMDTARKTLNSSKDQGVFDALYGSNKDNAGNKIPSSYDPNNSPFVAQALLSHPEVLKAATQFYQAFNAQTGQAIDPLYNLPPDQQQAALEIRAAAAFPGELSGDKKQLATELPANWQDQQSAYYNAVSASLQAAGKGGPQPGAPVYPTQSAQVQADFAAGNTKSDAVQQWYAQLDSYNNAKRASMGLPQIAAYGFGPSGTQIPNPSNPYAKKVADGTTPNPTFAGSGSSGGGSRATGKGSRGGKISIAKGAKIKAPKMPKVATAKMPKVAKVKVAKISTRPKAVKIAGIKPPKRLRLA